MKCPSDLIARALIDMIEFVPGYGGDQVYHVLAVGAAVHEMRIGIGMREVAERTG